MGDQIEDTEPKNKRLQFLLTEKAYRELFQMAIRHRYSVTELVRLGIGLAKVCLQAKEQNHRMLICDKNNKVVIEIKIPQ